MPDFFGGKLHEGKKDADKNASDTHFNQPKKRDAEFIKVPNDIQNKVGRGGLSQTILDKAQDIIEKNSFDFVPEAQRQLTALREGMRMIQSQRQRFETDSLVAIISQPAIQLKSNGTTFGYPLVTKIAMLLIRFIEALNDIDDDAVDVIDGFNTALNAVIVGQMKGDGGEDGAALYDALEQACQRYFDKSKKTD